MDANGYIGDSIDNLLGNFCYVTGDDYRNKGLGQVQFPSPENIEIAGKSYPTVIINNQQWIAANLDLKWNDLTIGLSNDSSVARADYYDSDESTYGWNGLKYGLLYNYTAYNYINDHLSDLGIPSGWRLPTTSDINALYNTTTILGAKSVNWNGTDLFGFGAVGSGQYYYQGGGFIDKDVYFICWFENRRYIWISSSNDSNGGTDPAAAGHTIRLVKDLSQV